MRLLPTFAWVRVGSRGLAWARVRIHSSPDKLNLFAGEGGGKGVVREKKYAYGRLPVDQESRRRLNVSYYTYARSFVTHRNIAKLPTRYIFKRDTLSSVTS